MSLALKTAATLLTALSLAMPLASRAEADTTPPACLAPMQPTESDPALRDPRYTVSSDKKWVTVLACVVSNLDRIAVMGVNFSVFDADGHLINANGQGLGALNPIQDPTPSHPKIVNVTATTIGIDPRYDGRLLNMVLVQLTWAPCKDPPPAQCVPDATRTSTFLRQVTP